MIALDRDAIFIVGAYLGVLIAVVGLVTYSVVASIRVKARLSDLDVKGIRRRSAERAP